MSCSKMLEARRTPALLMHKSKPPQVRAAVSNIFSTDSSSATFTLTAKAVCFFSSAFKAAASFSAPSRFKSAIKTTAPCFTKPRTSSSPKPCAPPVTRAVLFFTTSAREAQEAQAFAVCSFSPPEQAQFHLFTAPLSACARESVSGAVKKSSVFPSTESSMHEGTAPLCTEAKAFFTAAAASFSSFGAPSKAMRNEAFRSFCADCAEPALCTIHGFCTRFIIAPRIIGPKNAACVIFLLSLLC